MEWNHGTEVSEDYFFMAGLSTLAACVNGQIWVRQGKFIHYPNLYIVLLGPPANGKTVAIDRAEEIVRGVGEITVSGQSETAEGLVRFMRDKCLRTMVVDNETIPFTPISLYLSELSNFFGKDPAGMVDFITGVWDRGGRTFHRRTKGQGEDIIPRPNVNLLAGTTPAWITQYLKADIVGGGFTRRVIMTNVLGRDPNNRVAWPEDKPEQLRARDSCIAYGKVLRGLYGEMKLADDAKALYTHWYNTRTVPKTDEELGYFGSKPALLFKTSMLLAISREPELVIKKNDVEVALAILERSETHRHRVFQSMGRNELSAVAGRVIDMLLAVEPIAYKDTLTGKEGKARFINEKQLRGTLYNSGNTRELDDVLTHLERTDRIFKLGITKDNITRVFIGLKE